MKSHLRLSRGARIFGACLLAALLVCSVVAVTPAVLQKVNAASCDIHQVGTPVSGSSSLANYTVYLMYNSCTDEAEVLAGAGVVHKVDGVVCQRTGAADRRSCLVNVATCRVYPLK